MEASAAYDIMSFRILWWRKREDGGLTAAWQKAPHVANTIHTQRWAPHPVSTL